MSGLPAPPPAGVPPERTSEEEDQRLIDAVAGRVVRMGLAVPAIFFLESTKPLSYIGSQVLVFLEPFVKSVLTVSSYDRFVTLLEDRANVEKLLRRIEDLDEAAREREKEEKKRAKAERGQGGGERQPGSRLTGPGQAARPAHDLPGERPLWRRILRRIGRGRTDTGA